MGMPELLAAPSADVYYSDNYVVLDFEIDTSHGDYGHPIHPDNQMLLASWRVNGGDMQSRWGGEYDFDDLIEAVERADFIVAHNAKYELSWLRRMGCDLHNMLAFDTQLAEYVIMGNLANGDKVMRGRSISLDNCCRRRGWKLKDPVVDVLMKHGINPVEHPRPWLQGRCEQDVETTEQLFLDQRELLARTKRLGVLLTRCILTPVLADMEFQGMCLDVERVEEEYDAHTALYHQLAEDMRLMTGGINWRSPLQVGEYLYDKLGFRELKRWDRNLRREVLNRTAKGRPRTDDKTLEKLEATTNEQRDFLALRKRLGSVNAALTKNLHFFKGVCQEKGGVFHAVFNQTSTATHRLSSSGIATEFELFDGAAKTAQFQNLPRAFKRLFRAKRDGWLMGEWDGSQLEFRVAARLGGPDERAIADIIGGHDVHRFTASVLTGIPEADLAEWLADEDHPRHKEAKGYRQDAKPDTFKPLYGGSKGTKEQEAYYAAFRERYQGIAAEQTQWTHDVINSPYRRLTTPWGLRYYWPYAKMYQSGYVNVTSSVYNYPIQCLATAEIIPVAVVYFWHGLRERGLEDYIQMVNSIHDSVICEIHPDYVEEFTKLAVDIWHDVYRYLREVYSFDFLDVPLGTGVAVGKHWNEAQERSFNIYSDGNVEEIE